LNAMALGSWSCWSTSILARGSVNGLDGLINMNDVSSS
jgi:hypothetical protein